MNWLAGLVASVLEKILAWALSFIAKEYLEKKKIIEDQHRAEENEKELEQSKTEEERRKNAEDLLNGNS